MTTKVPHLEPLSELLKEIIKKNLAATGKINNVEDLPVEWKNIIEYQRKMRVSALEKFNGPGYLCGLSYYASEKNKQENNASGSVLLYIEEEFVENLLKALGHTGNFDEDPEQATADKCGTFLKTIGEQFKNELQSHGYQNLIMSDIVSTRNSIPQGIDFPYDQYNLSELTFQIKGKKILISELSMTNKK